MSLPRLRNHCVVELGRQRHLLVLARWPNCMGMIFHIFGDSSLGWTCQHQGWWKHVHRQRGLVLGESHRKWGICLQWIIVLVGWYRMSLEAFVFSSRLRMNHVRHLGNGLHWSRWCHRPRSIARWIEDRRIWWRISKLSCHCQGIIFEMVLFLHRASFRGTQEVLGLSLVGLVCMRLQSCLLGQPGSPSVRLHSSMIRKR